MAVQGGNEDRFRYQRLSFEGLATKFTSGATTSEAVTLNDHCLLVTTNALDAAANAAETIVITNNKVAAGDVAMVFVVGGTTAGTPIITKTVCTAGTITITLTNKHASAALDGTVVLAVILVKALTA